MQDEMFVYPFLKGNNRIVLVAGNLEEAKIMVFGFADHNEVIIPLNQCEIGLNKRVMGGFQVIRH